jgi:RHS repeat-associated protein
VNALPDRLLNDSPRTTSHRLCLLAVLLLCSLFAPPWLWAQTEQIEYYALDAIGSVRVVFDATGAVKGRMDYAPFGEELFSGLFVPTDRFAQLSRDAEAGLDYAQARMFQLRTGRFSGIDPVSGDRRDPQTWNRYAYARNNPLRGIDPSGTETQTVGVNCQIGSYWCPGSRDIFKPDWADKYFDPAQYGYQGGEEMASAEAAYDAGVSSAFMTRALAAYSEQQPQGSASTNTDVMLPNGKIVTLPNAPTKCSGPAPGCRVVSLSPGQAPFWVTDTEYAQIQKRQIALVASVLSSQVRIPGLTVKGVGDYLFARGGQGLLNSNNWIRLGYGWQGSATAGRDVFRLVVGNKNAPIHIHVTLWRF